MTEPPAQPSSAVSRACEQLARVDGNPMALEPHLRAVVLADTALGIIDNGGFEFFESDLPGQPDYAVLGGT